LKFKNFYNLYINDHAYVRWFLFNNFHTIDRDIYRSGQPTPRNIRKYKKKYNISIILTLRRPSDAGYYILENEEAKKNGIQLVDIPIRAKVLPDKETIKHILNLFDNLHYPILMHCKSGADRTGFVAALYLFYKYNDIDKAKSQLSYKFFHNKYTETGIIDAFFDELEKMGLQNNELYDWVENSYNKDVITKRYRKAKN
jgi:protein tyrosine/serine phosphatase